VSSFGRVPQAANDACCFCGTLKQYLIISMVLSLVLFIWCSGASVLSSPTATPFPCSSPQIHPPCRVFPAAVHFIFGAFLGVFAMGVQGGYLYTWVKGYTVVDARRRKQLRVSTATYIQARKVPFT
jgi:hypothetical protein